MALVLRPYSSADFDRICEIRGITTSEGRERFINRIKDGAVWFDHYLHLAIEFEGELAGDLQLRHCDRTTPPGAWDMGIEVAPELQGKGIGSAALKAAAEYAFSHGAHRVEGSTDETNIAMRKAFEKAGWKFEGVLKALFVEGETPHDYYSFAITKFD